MWSRGVGADVRACSFSMRPIVNVAVCRVFRRESCVAVKNRQTAGDVLVMAALADGSAGRDTAVTVTQAVYRMR